MPMTILSRKLEVERKTKRGPREAVLHRYSKAATTGWWRAGEGGGPSTGSDFRRRRRIEAELSKVNGCQSFDKCRPTEARYDSIDERERPKTTGKTRQKATAKGPGTCISSGPLPSVPGKRNDGQGRGGESKVVMNTDRVYALGLCSVRVVSMW